MEKKMSDDSKNPTDERVNLRDLWENYFDRFYKNRDSFAKWVIGSNVTAGIVCFSVIGSSIPAYWGRDCSSALESVDTIQAGRIFSLIFFTGAVMAIVGWRWAGLSEFLYLSRKALIDTIRRGNAMVFPYSEAKRTRTTEAGMSLVLLSTALFFILSTLGFVTLNVYRTSNLMSYRANVHLVCALDPIEPIPAPVQNKLNGS
jgi:hypothetical protein